MNDANDEIYELEENNDANEPLGAPAKVKQLKDQLKEAIVQRDEYLTGWQREKADAVNARREILADAERRSKRGEIMLIEDLIPILDSYDMAASSEAWAQVADGFRSGMEQVRNQLLDVFAKRGVERYGKNGDIFDPRLHEAVQAVDDVPGESQTIVKILRYGYKSGDSVLRAAQVIIKA